MNLSTEQVENLTLVTFLDPSLDAGNSREFVEILSPLLVQGARFVFDMSQVRFVDSSGLGSLMLCMRRLKAVGGALVLCGLSKSVMALFELVRMNRIFEVKSNRTEAIQALQPPPQRG